MTKEIAIKEGGTMNTLAVESHEDKVTLFNAVTNSLSVKDNIEKVINVTDVMINNDTQVSEETGEVEDTLRVYLIDVDGQVYSGSSRSLADSVANLVRIFGRPGDSENGSIPVKVVERRSGRNATRRYYMLELA